MGLFVVPFYMAEDHYGLENKDDAYSEKQTQLNRADLRIYFIFQAARLLCCGHNPLRKTRFETVVTLARLFPLIQIGKLFVGKQRDGKISHVRRLERWRRPRSRPEEDPTAILYVVGPKPSPVHRIWYRSRFRSFDGCVFFLFVLIHICFHCINSFDEMYYLVYFGC